MNRFLCSLVFVVIFMTENCVARTVRTSRQDQVSSSPKDLTTHAETIADTFSAPTSTLDDFTNNDTIVSMVLESTTPWEDFIMPSPAFIALLGQLMVISTKMDFSLVSSIPQGGFKYLRHPESFRGSLAQVSNDGWEAFMDAHMNMDKIQLNMQQVPRQVQTALKILSNASPKMIETLLPVIFNKIQEIGQTSTQLSAETESKFVNVLLLMGELLEASVISQGHKEILAEVQTELNALADRKKSMELEKELKKKQQKVTAEMAKRRTQYDNALQQIPPEWTVLTQDLARSIVNVVNFVPSVLGMGDNRFGGIFSTGPGSGKGNEFEKATSLGLIRDFFNSLGTIVTNIANIFEGKDILGSPKTFTLAFRTVLNTFEIMFKDTPTDITLEALGFINDSRSICDELSGLIDQFPSKPISQSDQAKVLQRFDSLLDKLKPYVAQASMASGSLTTGDQYVTGSIERYKTNLALAIVQDAESRQNKVFGDTMKYNIQMKELLNKLAKVNLQEVSTKDALEMLKDSIKLLSNVREQWSKLIEFFSLVWVRADVALNQTLLPIPGKELSIEERQFYVGLLKDQATDINKVAHYLYTLSSTYFDISNEYLMDRLAGLAKIGAVDSDDERQKLLIDLNNQAKEAQDAIKLIAEQNHDNSSQWFDGKIRELQDVVKKLGGPTQTDTKAIQSVYGEQK